MLENSIQGHIDRLSEHLQRSVAIDDTEINLIAVSKHFTALDDLRMQALIERKVEQGFVDYLYSFGILETDKRTLTVEAHEGLKILKRQCYPVRWENEIIGFLWLLGETDSAADAAAIATAKVIAFPLYGLIQARKNKLIVHKDFVHDLLFKNINQASQAVFFFEQHQKLSPKLRYRVISINVSLSTKEDKHAELAFIEEHVKNLLLINNLGHKKFHVLTTKYNTELLGIIPAHNLLENMNILEAFLEKIGINHARIGVGSRQDLLHLRDSYLTASDVAKVLCVFNNLRPVARQRDLGIYGKLAFAFMDKKDTVSTQSLTPNVHLLWTYGQELLDTLEIYLDNAGNISHTAEKLNIHRSTLYYRLTRIEEITKTSLKSGLDRLILHMEIKLWQLIVQNTISTTTP